MYKTNVFCKNCNTNFVIETKEIKKNKNSFCSRSCNAKFNNANRNPNIYEKLAETLKKNI